MALHMCDNAWVMHGAEFHKEKEGEVTCVKMMIFVYLNARLHVWLEYIIGNEMACVFRHMLKCVKWCCMWGWNCKM